MKPKLSIHAFTLIELLVTIAVLTIGLSVAVPSFKQMIENNQSGNISRDLINSINLAQSEAVKRNTSVSICPSSSQDFNQCGQDWTQGWLIFVNPDEDSIFADNEMEPLLRIQQIHTQTASIQTSMNNAILTFTSNGFAHADTAGLFILIKTTDCSGKNARKITISLSGKPQLEKIDC